MRHHPIASSLLSAFYLIGALSLLNGCATAPSQPKDKPRAHQLSVSIKKPIEPGPIERALRTCLFMGDRKAGIVSVMERVAQQIHGKDFAAFFRMSQEWPRLFIGTPQLPAGKSESEENGHFLSYSGEAKVLQPGKSVKSLEFQIAADHFGEDPDTTVNEVIYLEAHEGETGKDNLRRYMLFPGLPLLDYKKLTLKKTEDSHGNTSEQVLFHDLSLTWIEMPGEGDLTHFLDTETKKPTAITVNLAELSQCIKADMEKESP